MNEFSVVAVSRRKSHELVIRRRRIEYHDKTRILGFKFRKLGYPRYIENRAGKASMQLTKLKRFKAVKAKTNSYFYQSCNTHQFEIMHYLKLQRIQNRVLRQAYNDTLYPPSFTTDKIRDKIKTNKSEINTKGK